MKSSLFFAAVLLAVVQILLIKVNSNQKDVFAQVSAEQQAGQFLNYVAAFDELYTAGIPADGDASGRVTIPDWLPRNSQIQLRISNSTGYVFIPTFPGLYARVMQETQNSSHFGLSDNAGINTPSGRISRPAFVPAGYVVYVR